MGGAPTKIALLGADPQFAREIAPALRPSGVEVSSVPGSPESLDAQVLAGTFDGYLALPSDLSRIDKLEYVSRNAADFRVMGLLQSVIGPAIVARRLVAAGVPASQVASLARSPSFEERRLSRSGKTKDSNFVAVLMTGLTLSMLIYMTVLLYGQAIGRSVLAEKTSKTVEIMLSSVRPMDLLFGKILGKSMASLLQYGIWVTISAAAMKLFGPRLGLDVGAGLSSGMLAYLVLFFVLAFFLYCSVYAALGASAQDEQQLGQFAWPLIAFLAIPLVMISPILMAPRSPLAVALSFFPLTAPIVMFLRISVGAARGWEILLSVALTVAAAIGIIRLSAKIFKVGILMTGKRFRLREVLLLARYD